MKRNLTQMQATVITWILMFAIILSFFFMSCGTPKEIDNTTMQYELDTIVDCHFIDSVCIADTLAIYPVEWVYSPMRGYESKKDISTYGWMKSSNWTFYRIIKYEDGTYRLTKRTIQ